MFLVRKCHLESLFCVIFGSSQSIYRKSHFKIKALKKLHQKATPNGIYSDCQVLDQSVNHAWKNLKGGLNAKFQKQKPSRRTNGGFVNDVLCSWR